MTGTREGGRIVFARGETVEGVSISEEEGREEEIGLTITHFDFLCKLNNVGLNTLVLLVVLIDGLLRDDVLASERATEF
jgi:hypothetical protein